MLCVRNVFKGKEIESLKKTMGKIEISVKFLGKIYNYESTNGWSVENPFKYCFDSIKIQTKIINSVRARTILLRFITTPPKLCFGSFVSTAACSSYFALKRLIS